MWFLQWSTPSLSSHQKACWPAEPCAGNKPSLHDIWWWSENRCQQDWRVLGRKAVSTPVLYSWPLLLLSAPHGSQWGFSDQTAWFCWVKPSFIMHALELHMRTCPSPPQELFPPCPKPLCPTISSIMSHPSTMYLTREALSPVLPSRASKPDLNQARGCSPPLSPSSLPPNNSYWAGCSQLAGTWAGQARRLGGAAASVSRDFPSAFPHARSCAPHSLTSGGGGLGEARGYLGSVCSNNSCFPSPSGKGGHPHGLGMFKIVYQVIFSSGWFPLRVLCILWHCSVNNLC